ncbi:MAG: hypothetical protein LBQ12_15150 [Deltaproteobacteria bacterium]|nr:hypothetical protein [Deltaproteobacteria bacterium]
MLGVFQGRFNAARFAECLNSQELMLLGSASAQHFEKCALLKDRVPPSGPMADRIPAMLPEEHQAFCDREKRRRAGSPEVFLTPAEGRRFAELRYSVDSLSAEILKDKGPWRRKYRPVTYDFLPEEMKLGHTADNEWNFLVPNLSEIPPLMPVEPKTPGAVVTEEVPVFSDDPVIALLQMRALETLRTGMPPDESWRPEPAAAAPTGPAGPPTGPGWPPAPAAALSSGASASPAPIAQASRSYYPARSPQTAHPDYPERSPQTAHPAYPARSPQTAHPVYPARSPQTAHHPQTFQPVQLTPGPAALSGRRAAEPPAQSPAPDAAPVRPAFGVPRAGQGPARPSAPTAFRPPAVPMVPAGQTAAAGVRGPKARPEAAAPADPMKSVAASSPPVLKTAFMAPARQAGTTRPEASLAALHAMNPGPPPASGPKQFPAGVARGAAPGSGP